MNLKDVSHRLFAYITPHKAGIALGILCFFASAAIEPLVPALLKQLLDKGFRTADIAFPVWLVPVAVIGLFATRGLLAFTGTYLFNWSTSQAVLALRTDLIRSVMRADASLYTQLSPGVAATRVINDPHHATSSLAGALTTILRDGTTLLALLGYLFYLNWKLTLISLVTMPLLGYVVRTVQKRVLSVGSRSYESQIKLVGIVDDITRAWRVVRTFDAGEFEHQRFTEEAKRLRRMTLKSVAAGATMTPLTQVVASAGVALILTLALIDANRGGTSVGEFVAFITAMLMTISPMRHLTDVTQPIIGGLIGARACFDLMDTPPEPDTGTRELEAGQCRGDIRFDRVTVVYPGSEHKALNQLELEIPAGKTIALVGPSGSGKTTIVNAMLGFVAPTEGRITLDGIDITEIRKASLRRQFAVVSQDIVLFDGPLADNVAYAAPKDMARIEACLKAANLWDFVQSQPEGVNMMIGTNGSRLSGGQRQRLAIARALYKQARIWVFDEATSALDSESERIVQQSIEQWHGEKTLILIAHRLSTVRNADRIYVMSDGRVVEAGTHKELMERGGLYAGMVAAQAME
ncbi:lipid A export permease/ATP-binding protein MsbA [Caldimonas aquatica]|uniref:Lipid A export permease/ATP-binding protein MsbA n=1 Tax=Caldimonas aquatica TaxID=376175 RepID=A0ABY6MUW5_9BURK|nr:lipid A export permease/ATP-binding protein MsbA [Schlegelella aquatica]UZD55789.1 lipid A export permease/ATP-binding protein MsbA [Schlegelella aquatica]